MHTAARHHSHSHSRRPDPPAPPKWTSATDPRLAQIKRQHKAAMAKLPETERQQLEREYREQRHLAGEWRKKMEVRRAEDERQRIKTLRRHSFVSMEQLRHAPRPQPDDAHARQQVRRSLPAHDQRAAPAPLPAAYQYPATGHPNIAPHHDASYDQQHQEREQDDCCLNAQLVCCDVSSVIGHMLASFISIILTILLGTTHLLIASIFISGCIVLDIIGNIIRFILCFLLCMLIAEEYDFEWNLTRVAFGWARETRWVSRTVKWTTLGYMHREPRAEATHPDVEKGYYPGASPASFPLVISSRNSLIQGQIPTCPSHLLLLIWHPP